jgi:cytochrome P450/NADPH-cytochrome P450 reductase
MDAAVNKIKKDGPLIAITASYEGQPPDNAASFVAWLESIKDKKTFDGVQYAVFGCGHSDWRSTFQRIPTLVDSSLAEFGGTRLTERGVTDAARGDMYGEFEEWVDQHLLPCLSKDSLEGSVADYSAPELKLELSTQGRASHLQQSVQWGTVLAASSLTAPGQPEKRHIEIQLPSNTTYSVGDYLAVLPVNPISEVQRVIKRFRLPWDGIVSISDAGSTTLPVGTPLPLSELLKGYVELSQPATRKDIDLLATHATDPSDRRALLALAKSYTTSVLDPRISPLDLLETHPHLPLPFPAFLTLLPPLKPRHYSISSSPLACPTSCTLTYSVLSAPPRSGLPGRFRGVAGTHLASLAPGDAVQVAVRSTNKLFRPPPDLEATPMVMFCAGAGLAPFRGFVQERAVRVARGGRALAPALLFVGCRGGGTGDVLYREEFEEWARIGAVDVRYAFSRDPGASEGCKYVQDRVLRDRQDVFELWDRGAKIYVCGSREVANEVGVAAREMVVERMKEHGGKAGTAEVEAWFEDKRNERFISDIFS